MIALNSLTAAQKSRLDEQIEQVNFCLGEMSTNGQEAARIASKIRDEGHWKSVAKSWRNFCEINGWTHQRLGQIADFGSVLLSLPENVATIVANEGQARELNKAPPEARKHVVESLLEGGEKVTAKTIKKAVLSLDIKPKNRVEKQPTQLDSKGTRIPEHALPFWNRRQEIQDLLTAVSRIKSAIEKAKASEDPLFGRVSNAIIADLSKAYTHISEAKPFAVCTACEGSPLLQPHGCSYCCNTGLVSENKYTHMSRAEVKNMRTRLTEHRNAL